MGGWKYTSGLERNHSRAGSRWENFSLLEALSKESWMSERLCRGYEIFMERRLRGFLANIRDEVRKESS